MKVNVSDQIRRAHNHDLYSGHSCACKRRSTHSVPVTVAWPSSAAGRPSVLRSGNKAVGERRVRTAQGLKRGLESHLLDMSHRTAC